MNSKLNIHKNVPTDAVAELASERAAHAGTRARLRLLENKLQIFAPRDMISLLNKGSLFNVSLGDQVEKKMAVMFSDIRDFTILSESMTSQQTFNMINAYLSMMNPVISAHQGIIDKYMGDAIMALFPTPSDDALSAGLAMLARLKEYNAGRLRAGYRQIRIGIGINTGLLMLGIIGGGNRMEGTVVGRTVNLASRLEAFTKVYGTQLLISEHTFYSLANPQLFSIRYLGRVKMSEKTHAESIYEVFDCDTPHIKELKTKSLKKFEEALVYYHSREVTLALPLLEDIVRENPDDNPAKTYLMRCHDYIETGRYIDADESDYEANYGKRHETGFAEIDRQQDELLSGIQKLHQSVTLENNQDATLSALDSLGKNIHAAFEFEEDLMKNHFYPFTSDHIAQHDSFRNHFVELRKAIETNTENHLLLGFRVNLFLTSRLLNHLTCDDNHLWRFLNEYGVPALNRLPVESQ